MLNNQIPVFIYQWYELNKRDLPWRETTDPYQIWVSEIILQQTKVVQGLGYYYRFLDLFPSVQELANASMDDVLKAWQGLGYYSRARNLYQAAKLIVELYKGEFPNTYKEVISLPGIGEYTAAAICSFAYNQPYAVLDGNVFRVLSRLFGINTPIDTSKGKLEFQALATSLLNQRSPALHNQAMMEFGALQCLPQAPDCEACVLKTRCFAFFHNQVERLPVKLKKTKIRTRHFNYLVIKVGVNTFLQKRESDDVWKGLYEFPLIESTNNLVVESLMIESEFKLIFSDSTIKYINPHPTVFKHVLSHQVIFAKFWEIDLNKFHLSNRMRVNWNEIHLFPTSKLIENYLNPRT
jgi:A/G-specific adenine glycosylase